MKANSTTAPARPFVLANALRRLAKNNALCAELHHTVADFGGAGELEERYIRQHAKLEGLLLAALFMVGADYTDAGWHASRLATRLMSSSFAGNPSPTDWFTSAVN